MVRGLRQEWFELWLSRGRGAALVRPVRARAGGRRREPGHQAMRGLQCGARVLRAARRVAGGGPLCRRAVVLGVFQGAPRSRGRGLETLRRLQGAPLANGERPSRPGLTPRTLCFAIGDRRLHGACDARVVRRRPARTLRFRQRARHGGAATARAHTLEPSTWFYDAARTATPGRDVSVRDAPARLAARRWARQRGRSHAQHSM